MLIDVQSDQRVLITGQTGSGKTFLARQLLRSCRRLVVLDPKGMLRSHEEEGAYESWDLDEWSEPQEKLLVSGKPCRIRVPSPLDGRWDRYLWSVYRAGNCVLYIDEVYGVVPPGSRRPPDSLNAIYTRGRELGIGAVAASQRPVWVPMEIISECEWFFAFRLLLDDDRRRLASLMGPNVMQRIRDRYGFWTYNVEWDESIYTPQLEVEPVRVKSRERSA